MKKKYNELVNKIKQAEKWIEANEKRNDIDVYVEKYAKSLDKANELLKKIEAELGREMTREEVLNGFI